MSRRVLVLVLAALLAAVTACSTGSTTSTSSEPAQVAKAESNSFPVTIKHAYGSTTITEQPQRIATLGWSDHDMLLSLGVVPVGATAITWGGNAQQSTRWFDAQLKELGGEQPVRYSDADGAPVDEVAKLAPDLILATNSGITKEEYDKLSELAPVVAYPGEPWGTSWQESMRMVGQAVGRPHEADRVIADTERVFTEAAREHPEFTGASAVFTQVDPKDTSKISVYLPLDNRPRLLEDFGFRTPPIVEQLGKNHPGQFYGAVSAERARTVDADVMLTYGDQGQTLQMLQGDELLSRIPAVESGGTVVVGAKPSDAVGWTSPSPLSIPPMVEAYAPRIAQALKAASTT